MDVVESVIVSNAEVMSGIPGYAGTAEESNRLHRARLSFVRVSGRFPDRQPRHGRPGAGRGERLTDRANGMKLLLDECVPERLRSHLPGHEVHSVRFAGFSGRKNGDLLRLTQRAGYDVLLTVDQEYPTSTACDAAIRSLNSISPGAIIELVFPGTNAK